MTVVPLGRGRRWGAVVLLRLASAILRGATALYLKRTISSAELRAAQKELTAIERRLEKLAGQIDTVLPRRVSVFQQMIDTIEAAVAPDSTTGSIDKAAADQPAADQPASDESGQGGGDQQ